MASYNRALILIDNSVAAWRGGGGVGGGNEGGGREVEEKDWDGEEEREVETAGWLCGQSQLPATCLKWEGAGSRAGLGAESSFGQPQRHAGCLALGSRLCGASHRQLPCPSLVCDPWMGLLQSLAYLIPVCQVGQGAGKQ